MFFKIHGIKERSPYRDILGKQEVYIIASVIYNFLNGLITDQYMIKI